jgi:hypothetical protein
MRRLLYSMRMARALVVLWLGAACANAQPSPSTEARRLLQSANLRDRAWGAWYAGVSQDASLRPALLEQLRRAEALRDSARDSAEYAYVQLLFDALIQIPGSTPVDVLMPFEKSWRAEILILLARPGADSRENALLEMRGHAMPDAEWRAANDLLFQMGSQRFFQAAFAEIQLTRHFIVTDQNGGICGGSGICRESTRHFPAGYPPIALYQFNQDMTGTGDILLGELSVPVYYRRTVVPTDGEAEWMECQSYPAFTTVRQMILTEFLGAIDNLSRAESENLFMPLTQIRWRGAFETAAEMDVKLDEQSAAFRKLVSDAQKRNLFNASGMVYRIATTVDDVRRDRREHILEVAPREIVIP